MVSAEKGDTYDNRGYGFRTEYETLFERVGAFYRTWDDEETNTRFYSTFEAFPGLFSGIIRYQIRIPTKFAFRPKRMRLMMSSPATKHKPAVYILPPRARSMMIAVGSMPFLQTISSIKSIF
jgi:hypothetical protein